MRQLQKVKLRCRPDDPFLSPITEVHTNQRETKHELNQKVAVAGNVQTVCCHAFKPQPPSRILPVDRQRGPCQRRRSKAVPVRSPTTIRQTLTIALELFAVSQPNMSGEHRLGSPQMGIGRHDHARIPRTAFDEDPLQCP